MGRKWVEKRKRGVFGWLFLMIFWGWNALMAWATIAGMSGTAELAGSAATEAERAGHAIGAGVGLMMLLLLWAAGAVVFELLAYFTRGKREMIEVET